MSDLIFLRTAPNTKIWWWF